MYRLGDLMGWGPSLAEMQGHGSAERGTQLHWIIGEHFAARERAFRRTRLRRDLAIALGWTKVVYLNGDIIETSSEVVK